VTTNWLTLDEWHVVFRIPARLPGPADRAARLALADRRFVAAVERAVRAVVRSRPSLTPVRVTLAH
jgi:hypothetical protein